MPTPARTSARVPRRRRTARPIRRAISSMSASVMPWVVTAGVPTRMPEAIDRRLRVVRDGVLVQRDAARRRSGSSASRPLTPMPRRSSNARWVSVPPVTGRIPDRGQPRGQRPGVGDHLPRVGLVLRLAPRRGRPPWPRWRASAGRPASSGTPPCPCFAACSALHTIMPPRGPRSTLWVVKMTTSACGTGDGIALPATSPMKCAASTIRIAPDLVGDLAERGEVDQPRVRRAAADDHLRPVLGGQGPDLVVVDQLGVRVARRSRPR